MNRILCTLVLLCAQAFGAADYAFNDGAIPFMVITVTTSATVTVYVSGDDLTIVHLNIQNDGSTASVSTDRIYVMRKLDGAAAAVTMVTDLTDGVKLPINAGGSASITGKFVTRGSDGQKEIQIKATGNGAKVLLLRGRSPKEEN